MVIDGKSSSDIGFAVVWSEVKTGFSSHSMYACDIVCTLLDIFTLILSYQLTSTDRTMPIMTATATMTIQIILEAKRFLPVSNM